jgi:hypothetical protein
LENCNKQCCDFYLEGNIHHSLQNTAESQLLPPAVLHQKGGKGQKKLRLFEYLYESLPNPDMTSCIQWVDKNKAIFQFVSKNKENLWGKRRQPEDHDLPENGRRPKELCKDRGSHQDQEEARLPI